MESKQTKQTKEAKPNQSHPVDKLNELLIDAVMNRDGHGVKLLLEVGASANARGDSGKPAIFKAAMFGPGHGRGTTETLLDHGADINMCVRGGSTLSHLVGNMAPMDPMAYEFLWFILKRGAAPSLTLPVQGMNIIDFVAGVNMPFTAYQLDETAQQFGHPPHSIWQKNRRLLQETDVVFRQWRKRFQRPVVTEDELMKYVDEEYEFGKNLVRIHERRFSQYFSNFKI
jgi:hypothetical protein